MITIVGYGNELRGEDAFGVDVLKKLELKKLKNTKLLSLYQLTPEIALEFLDSDKIVFIDAFFSQSNNYSLCCSLVEQKSFHLTHHISYRVIIYMLNNLYNKFPSFEVCSMSTNNFETIYNISKYTNCVDQVVNYLSTQSLDV